MGGLRERPGVVRRSGFSGEISGGFLVAESVLDALSGDFCLVMIHMFCSLNGRMQCG